LKPGEAPRFYQVIKNLIMIETTFSATLEITCAFIATAMMTPKQPYPDK
jgi:hypothetical protein